MSGISGRHAASHAKPAKLGTTAARVTTAFAVTGAVVVGGGVAATKLPQLRHTGGNQQAADTEAGQSADAQAAQDLSARNAALGVADRSQFRAPLVATGQGTAGNSLAADFTRPAGAPATAGSTPPGPATTGPTIPLPSASTTGPGPTTPSSAASTTPKATPSTTGKPAPTSSSSSGSSSATVVAGISGINASPAQARAIAQQLVATGQFGCFDSIITRESSWNIHATNASSGAYGLPQALPGSKMGTVAADWRTNAITQIKWAIGYMTSRYGSPCAAWAFWQAHNWY